MLRLLFFILTLKIYYCFIFFADFPKPGQMDVQFPATEFMIGIMDFHNYLICIIFGIGIAVTYLLCKVISSFGLATIRPKKKKFAHANELEICWTTIPALILIAIAYPSFKLLYILDEDWWQEEFNIPSLVFKITGYQWYWKYESMIPLGRDSKRLKVCALSYIWTSVLLDPSMGDPVHSHFRKAMRLLFADEGLTVLHKTPIRLLITSADVIHSWAVPSFGIKLDACPGRIAHIDFNILRTGMFYGQCSEICGAGHGFMPIFVRCWEFEQWYKYFVVDLPVEYNLHLYRGKERSYLSPQVPGLLIAPKKPRHAHIHEVIEHRRLTKEEIWRRSGIEWDNRVKQWQKEKWEAFCKLIRDWTGWW